MSKPSTPASSPLKVMPPKAKAAPPTPTPQTPPSERPAPIAEPLFALPRWVVIAGVLTAVTGAAFIPVPNHVMAEGTLEPRTKNYVFMPVPGTVTEFLVEKGEFIAPNTAIAHVSTADLEDEIIATQQQLREQERQFTQLQQHIPVLQSRVYETQMASQAIQNQAGLINQRLTGEPAAVLQVEQQQASMAENIKALEAEITYLNEQEAQVRETLKRYQDVLSQPRGKDVLSITEVERKESELSNLLSAKARKTQEIRSIQQQIAGKSAEIAALRHDWQDDLSGSRDRWQQNNVGTVTAQRELLAAQSELTHLQALVQTSQQQLKTLQERRENSQKLIAEEGGLVLSTDLDEKLGRKMQEDESVLEVANISTLDAVIDVPQVDTPIVKEGAIVEIRFREPGRPILKALIQEIDPELKTDETGQKQLLTARAQIENPNRLFLPNQQIRAQILGGKIPLYRKIILEVRKHIDWTRYGVGQ